MKKDIYDVLKERVLILDGAYGTEFMKVCNLKGRPPEILNLEAPEVVERLQRSYVEAGADILLTNTFGATPAKLKKSGLEDEFENIVRAAVRIAKKVSEGRVFVFGDIGPTGELPYPIGKRDYDFFYNNFYKQAKLLIEEGVDGIILETFSDILELKSAIRAVRDISNEIFLIAHLTFDEKGRTLTGTTPEIFSAVLQDYNVDALGINCTLGPEEMLPVFQDLASRTGKFLSVEPNAGMPVVKEGKTVYPVSADEFAYYAESYWESGANIIGGCCGTTPEHIKKLKRVIGDRKPLERSPKKLISVTSAATFVDFSGFVVIGERINPAGRKKLRQALENGFTDIVFEEARVQLEKGADLLDVNFGVEQFVSDDTVRKTVMGISYSLSSPLSIDVQTQEKLVVAMKNYPGRPILNSIKVSQEDIYKIEILKRYGGMVVLLAMGDNLPKDFKDRVKAFEKGVRLLEDYGIDRERIIVDPVVIPAGAGGDVRAVLDMIKHLSELGFLTTMGVSNVSFGLPNRSYYNTALLVMALQNGLTSAIVNPLDEKLMGVLNASLVILRMKELPKKRVDTSDELTRLLLKGDSETLLTKVKEFLIQEKNALDVVEKYLKPAMEKIGVLYEKGKIFLPQLILASQTAKVAFDYLSEKLSTESGNNNKKVVIATVKGDIHDIGKNIVSAVMRSYGYEVIDLGHDVPAERIVEVVKREKPIVVALSAMMTTTAPRISEVVRKLKEEGLNVPVLVGGASLNERFAKELGAHYYASNPTEGVSFLKKLEGRRDA